MYILILFCCHIYSSINYNGLYIFVKMIQHLVEKVYVQIDCLSEDDISVVICLYHAKHKAFVFVVV